MESLSIIEQPPAVSRRNWLNSNGTWLKTDIVEKSVLYVR